MGGRHVRSRCCDGSGHANGVHVSTAIRDLGCLANTFPNARLHMEFHGRGRRHSHNLVQLLRGAAPRSGFGVLRTHMVGRGWLLVPQTLHTSTALEAPAACFPSRSCCTRRARFPSLRAPRLPFKILDMECTDCIRFDLCDEVFVRSSLSLADAAAASRDVFPVLSHRSLATNAVSTRRKASLRAPDSQNAALGEHSVAEGNRCHHDSHGCQRVQPCRFYLARISPMLVKHTKK